MVHFRPISLLPTELLEAIMFMTYDAYLYISLGFSFRVKDLVMFHGGPGIMVSQFLEKEDNIRHLLFMKKYIPDDILIAKAAMTMNANMLRRVMSICRTNCSDFAYRTCVSLGFVEGANMIDHDIKVSKFAIDNMYITGNMPEMVHWTPQDGIVNRMYYKYISRQNIRDMLSNGMDCTKLLVVCLCNSYMEEIDHILSHTNADLYDALKWYTHEDNPHIIPYIHAKYAPFHPYQPNNFVLCVVYDTWTKPCGLQIVEYFKHDDWISRRSIIMENVEEIHEHIDKDAGKVASLLMASNKLSLVDITRISQNQVIDIWDYVDDTKIAIKLLNRIKATKNSALTKQMYVNTHNKIRFCMIKAQLVTDRGFIAKHASINTVACFRLFGPYIYTKRTFKQHIPSSLSVHDRDDMIWLIHNIKTNVVVTSDAFVDHGIRVSDNVIYFHHVSQLIPIMVDRYAFASQYNMIAIDASLYYMNV
jgi:hypothetical protein